jgi:hypothetical protein
MAGRQSSISAGFVFALAMTVPPLATGQGGIGRRGDRPAMADALRRRRQGRGTERLGEHCRVLRLLSLGNRSHRANAATTTEACERQASVTGRDRLASKH